MRLILVSFYSYIILSLLKSYLAFYILRLISITPSILTYYSILYSLVSEITLGLRE
jgi:hypothetical protein